MKLNLSIIPSEPSFVAIVQARMGSTRLPGKVLTVIEEKPVLEHIIDRVRYSKNIHRIIVATTILKEDDVIEELCKKLNVECFRGNPEDVLDRYYQAALKYRVNWIVRITADCPVIDPVIIDKMITCYKKNIGRYDYFSNVYPVRTYPLGLDVEIFTFATLRKLWENAKDPVEREHVTLYIHRHPEKFKIYNYKNKKDFSKYRWTLDTIEDLMLIKEIYGALYQKNKIFLHNDILALMKKRPELPKINEKIKQKTF